MRNVLARRFDLLDGLRGIAAIAVMAGHYTQHIGLDLVAGGFVAVDLFFVLSGFVIAYSYATKLGTSMNFREFVFARFARLGPLYSIGLIFGVCAALITLSGPGMLPFSMPTILSLAELGAAWLPYFGNLSWPLGNDIVQGAIFPLNDPTWSLFFEVVVNGVFAVYVIRFRKLPNFVYPLIAYVMFIGFTAVTHEVNPGWRAQTFLLGFPRVFAQFFAGVCIFSMGLQNKTPRPLLTSVVVLVMLAGFFIDVPRLSFLNSITLAPLSVALLCSIPVIGIVKQLCEFLGAISYPVYVIHFPIYRLAYSTFLTGAATPAFCAFLLGCFTVLLAWVLGRADLIVRRKLTNLGKPAATVVF